jgi:hypothetical protein
VPASSEVKLRFAVVDVTDVAEVAVITGATASVTVTAMVCGEPINDVWVFPT